MQINKKLASYIIFALLAVIVSVIGVALSKSIVINSVNNRIGLQSVYRDGWMESVSSIDLSKLPSGLAKVHLVFDSYRPDNVSSKSALLLVRLCGQQVAELAVTQQLADFWLKIPESCQSGVLEFEVKNPFTSIDGRRVGLKFVEADFRFNLSEVVNIDQTVLIAAAMLILILLAIIKLQLPTALEYIFILAVCSLAVVCLAFISWDNSFQLYTLGVTLLLILLGANFKEPSFPKLADKKSAKWNSAQSLNCLGLICLITLAAGILRFYAIDFGFPDRYHPDEPRKAGIALKMVQTGDLDPNYFLHPSLLLYLSALLTKIVYELGLATQLDTVLANLCGRMVSASAGTLSVPLLYLMARQFFASKVALLAAAIFAFSPLAITCSRYLKEDSLLLFFVLLTAYLSFLASNRNSLKFLLLAGFTAGLAAGSKYSGLLAFVAVASTAWLKSKSIFPDPRQLLYVMLAGLLLPIGFLMTTPYSLLNYNKFVSNFLAEKGHMLTGHHKVVISSWSQYWMYHLSRSMPPAISWPVLLTALLAVGAILRNFRIQALIILGLFLTFYLPAESVNAKPPPQPERYIFPCLPFLALIAAYFCHLFSRKSQILAAVLAFILVAAPAYRSIGLASEMVPDTRVEMADWINQNIKHGSKVYIDAQPYSAFLPADKFNSKPMWTIDQRRAMTVENLQKEGIEYLLLTSPSYERYFLTRSADQIIRERFADVFDNWLLLKEIKSDFGYYGFHNPTLRLYKVERKS